MAHSAAETNATPPSLSPRAGEHTHTIVGYSLIKGIGDGEPIASERFTVGGHEWVSVLLRPKLARALTAACGR